MTQNCIRTMAKTKLVYEGLHLDELTKILTVLTKENFCKFCEKNEYDFDELKPFKIQAEDTGYYEDYGFDFAETYKLIFSGSGWGSWNYSIKDAEKIELRSDWYDYLKAVYRFIYETTGIGEKES